MAEPHANAPLPPNRDPSAPVYVTQPPLLAVPPGAVVPLPERQVVSPPVSAQVRQEIRLYSHSPLFYWWPAWVCGYILAGLSYFRGTPVEIAPDVHSVFYPSTDLGVAFLLTLFCVILITNVTVRGTASALVIVSAILVVVLISYFRAWDQLLNWFAGLNIYLNTGAYFWFATLMFITWIITVLIVDHMSFWSIKPGQITQHYVLGGAAKSFDTQNVVIEKYRSDLFRHWILGMGAGDLRIETQGAQHESIFLPNVLFIGAKLGEIQNLIATRPTEFGGVTVR